MNHKHFLGKTLKVFSIAFLTSPISFGAVIYDSGVTALRAADPIQLGRLSRSGTPSDWSAPKTFPGVLNATTSYRYAVFNIPVSPFPYLQISFDDISATNVFASAYLNSYNPSSTAANRGLDVNYLGDAGSSLNDFGTDPVAFQVVLPSPVTNHLLIVVNDATGTTSTLGQSFRILVEGFYDTNFNDTTPSAPEPATMALSGVGFAVACVAAYRRKRKQNN